jgi:hypothetical protein
MLKSYPSVPSFLIIWLILLCGCSSIDIFKENSEIPINKPYKSFVLINQEIGMQGFTSQFLDAQVQIHLQEALEKEGLVYDKEQPDLVIRYTSNEDLRKREMNNFINQSPFWGFRVWDPWMFNPNMNRTTESSYELVQVIVDFIDPKQDKMLMTLTGVTEVSSQKTKDNKILKTTDKIIERFILELQPSQ